MRAPTVIMQTGMVLALCWLMVDQACGFLWDREERLRKEATDKGLDLLVMKGSIRRAL